MRIRSKERKMRIAPERLLRLTREEGRPLAEHAGNISLETAAVPASTESSDAAAEIFGRMTATSPRCD